MSDMGMTLVKVLEISPTFLFAVTETLS